MLQIALRNVVQRAGNAPGIGPGQAQPKDPALFALLRNAKLAAQGIDRLKLRALLNRETCARRG
ncbi:hypothetical protein D3C75_713470 [compost metagenome]